MDDLKNDSLKKRSYNQNFSIGENIVVYTPKYDFPKDREIKKVVMEI